jgi:two-component system LytT family sensor kinase
MNKSYKWQLVLVLVLFWTLLGLSFGAIAYSVADKSNPGSTAVNIFLMNLVRFYLWAALSPAIYLLTKKFGFERRETFPISFAVHLTAAILLAGIHSNVYSIITWAFGVLYFGTAPSFATLFVDFLFFGNFYLGILLYTLILIIIQAYLFFDRQQTELVRNSELQTELARAELQALKMQLQPHFLFNALHSISSLNVMNPPKANEMIARLGEFLRMTLERSDEQTVTLGEELEFLRCYLEIEQIRFSDRLTVDFEIAEETRLLEVPHLILQPIVENAVKYGIAPFGGRGTIKISARVENQKLVVRVADECEKSQGLAATDAISTGKGLQNTRSRLALAYGTDFRLELTPQGNGMCVRLEIPFAEDDSIVLT